MLLETRHIALGAAWIVLLVLPGCAGAVGPLEDGGLLGLDASEAGSSSTSVCLGHWSLLPDGGGCVCGAEYLLLNCSESEYCCLTEYHETHLGHAGMPSRFYCESPRPGQSYYRVLDGQWETYCSTRDPR